MKNVENRTGNGSNINKEHGLQNKFSEIRKNGLKSSAVSF